MKKGKYYRKTWYENNPIPYIFIIKIISNSALTAYRLRQCYMKSNLEITTYYNMEHMVDNVRNVDDKISKTKFLKLKNKILSELNI